MGSFNLFSSLLGWTFVPDFATKHLLNFVYKSSIPIVQPQLGSRQHRKHYAVTFAFVILGYLGYTLIQSARAMPPNFYQILGVPSDVDENGLKLAFRAFAKRYHPDRPGVGREGEEFFMYVRDAFEALKDPIVRVAYDRFGADVLGWRQHCKTTRDFLRQGLMISSGYHIVTGIALLFWSAIGRPSVVSFWRYVLFAALFAGELSFILFPFPASPLNILPPSPSFLSYGSNSSLSIGTVVPTTSILRTIFPNRVPYQHILFLHQLFMFLSVALTRVVPQFIALLGDEEVRKLDPVEREIWERISSTLAIVDREASIVLHTILHSISPATTEPYHEPTLARMQPLSPSKAVEALNTITPEMRNLVIEANIKNQSAGPIAAAWDAALRKVREKAGSQPPESTTTNSVPITPRSRNFWEKDVVEDEPVVSLVDVNASLMEVPGSPTTGGPFQTTRTPSTPRMRSTPNGSPTKNLSPVRRGSFVARAGEF